MIKERNANWEAAIRDAYPLLEQLEAIRRKWGVTRMEVAASCYKDIGEYSTVSVAEDLDEVEDGNLYMTAYNKIDGGGEVTAYYKDSDSENIHIGLPAKEVYGLSWRDFEDGSMNNEFTEWRRQADKEEEVKK